MLRYTTDRARPGLVTLYDIQPGNGASQFLDRGARMGPSTDRLVGWLLFNGILSIYRQVISFQIHHLGAGDKEIIITKITSNTLFSRVFLQTASATCQRYHQRVILSRQLTSTDN